VMILAVQLGVQQWLMRRLGGSAKGKASSSSAHVHRVDLRSSLVVLGQSGYCVVVKSPMKV
jgi:hypothetical protein